MASRHYKPFKPDWPVSVNWDSPQAQGLVGWWPGSGAGGKLWDASGLGNHGTLTNFAAPFTATSGWTSGVDGGRSGLALDGVDDQISVPTDAAPFKISGLTPFGYSFWFKLLAAPSNGGFKTLIAKGYNGSVVPYYSDFRTILSGSSPTSVNHLVAANFSGSSFGAISAIDFSQTANLGVWWHMTAAFGRSQITLYINGAPNGTPGSRLSITDNAKPLTLGYFDNNGTLTRWTNVVFDDIRFYIGEVTASLAYAMYSQPTRWQLRYVPGRRVYSFGSGLAPPSVNSGFFFAAGS